MISFVANFSLISTDLYHNIYYSILFLDVMDCWKYEYLMNEDKIIEKLIERRRALGVTQRHLAELSGLSEIGIKKIEGRKMNPTIKTLSKLVDVLGMELKLEIKQIHV